VLFIFSVYVVAVLFFAVVLGDRCRFWQSCLGPWDLLPPTFYLDFQSLDFERHLMKVIPETRRAH